MKRPATEAWLVAAALLCAFVLRFELARRFGGEAVWDGHYYEYYARRIADGFGYSDEFLREGVDVGRPSCHYPVGYSAALSVVYMLMGPTPLARALFGAGTGTLVVAFGWALARRAFGARSGRTGVATALLALHPGLALQAALVMSESLATATALGALCVAAELRGRGRPWAGALCGAACLGVSALVRPPALFLVPFLLPWHAAWPSTWRGLSWLGRCVWRRRVFGVLALCGAALLPILPWTARNCRAMDGCALVSTNGGWNLAIGAFPRATGRFETLRSEDGCSDVRGQVRQDRCWLHYGLGQIRHAPGHFLGLIPKKLHHTFDHESFPAEYLHVSSPAAWPEALRTPVREALSSWHRGLVVAAAAVALRWPRRRAGGVLARWREFVYFAVSAAGLAALAWWGLSQPEPTVWPLALVAAWAPLCQRDCPLTLRWMGALIGTVVATSVLFFGEDRYHMVATPALCVLAAAIARPLRAPSARADGIV